MNVKRRAPARAAGGTEERHLDWPGDPESLTAEAVDFEALAHVLANTCRRGGRMKRFHSLAAHAVTMSEAIEDLGRPRLRGRPGGGALRSALSSERRVAGSRCRSLAAADGPPETALRTCRSGSDRGGRAPCGALGGAGGALALHRPDGRGGGGARRPRRKRKRGHSRRLPAARPPHQATRTRPCGAALARTLPRPQETARRGRERRDASH